MRRPLSSFAPAALLALVLAATGCQQLFTTSLAAWAERDELPVPATLTKSQATDYATQVVDERDTELAQALLPAMADLLADNPNDPSVLASAAATASVATGLDQAFATALSIVGLEALTSGTPPTNDQMIQLVAALASVEVGSDASTIFSVLSTATPGEVAAMAESGKVTAGTFVIAAAAILIASVPDNQIEFLMDSIPGNDPTPSPTVVALLSQATTQWPGDPLIDALTGLLTPL